MPQEAEDCYDLIEWIAQQEWSNQKTALTGTSYQTWSQWFIAQNQPPHLTCINPNEGLSDGYRDLFYNGGIPDNKGWHVIHTGGENASYLQLPLKKN